MNGFINLLKPPGMTSSDAVMVIRRLCRGDKVGHAGTLDPQAAGVLPIMVGKATRLFDDLVDKDKTYVAELILGSATNTQDTQGTVIAASALRPNQEALEAILPSFTGEIDQVPPMFSAIKREGKKLYELARAGQVVEVAARRTWVHSIQILRQDGPGVFTLRVHCGKGTYVRTLCHDMGQALGCWGHMGYLSRTQAGSFGLDEAATLEALAQDGLQAWLTPMDAPLAHLPRVQARPSLRAACASGNPMPLSQVEVMGELGQGQRGRLYIGEDFWGIVRRAGDCLRFEAMLMDKGNL